MRRAGNVARMEGKNTYKDLVDKPEGQRALESLDGRLMLIWILKQQFCQLVSHTFRQPFNQPIS
jgi:hypothetical protein